MEENQQQPTVEIAARIDEEAYRRLYWIWLRGERALYFYGCIAVMAAFPLVAVWLNLHTRGFGVYLAAPLAMDLLLWLVFLRQPKAYYRKNRAAFAAECTYAFYEDKIHIRQQEEQARTEMVVFYERYPGAIETKTAFYLRKTGGQIYIPLDKKCFGAAECAALRALLREKYGARFREAK